MNYEKTVESYKINEKKPKTVCFQGIQHERIPLPLIMKAAKEAFPGVAFDKLEVTNKVKETHPGIGPSAPDYDYHLILKELEEEKFFDGGFGPEMELSPRITLQFILQRIKDFSPTKQNQFFLIPRSDWNKIDLAY